MFQIGDKIEFDLGGDVFKGTVKEVRPPSDFREEGVLWVTSDISGFVTWATPSSCRKV